MTVLDLSVATAFGILNDKLMLGVGYDFGQVVNRSRWFLVASLWFNFNN